MTFTENCYRGTVACICMFTYFTIALLTGLIPVYTKISGSSAAIKVGVNLDFIFTEFSYQEFTVYVLFQ